VGAARALAEYLSEVEHGPVTMIFGCMRDKDVAEITKILFSKAQDLILTQPDNSRAMPVDELASIAARVMPSERVTSARTVADAVRVAQQLTKADGVILVTGSLYLVGEVKSLTTI